MHTSEGLKQANFSTLQTARKQEDTLSLDYDRTAVLYAQGIDLPALRQYGQEVREEERKALVRTLEQTLAKPVKDIADFVAKLKVAGYEGHANEENKVVFIHEQTGARFATTELRPNSQALTPQLTAAIERTAQQNLSQSRGPKRGWNKHVKLCSLCSTRIRGKKSVS